MREMLSHIIDGIEWFRIDCRENEVDNQCARCGSSVTFVDCPNCVDGYSHHDCGEDCCCCADPDDLNVCCSWCNGRGGHWACVSSPEWCEAHPLPGRESIKSTAMNQEAWNDVN